MSVRPLRVLVAAPLLPRPDDNSGDVRLWRILELLLADGHEVAFLAMGGIRNGHHEARLEALGVEVVAPAPGPAPSMAGPPLCLRALLHRLRPDVVWTCFFHVAERLAPHVRAHAPAARLVVDTVDVHWVREQREAELHGDAACGARARRTREREQAAYAQADGLVAVSEDDAAALRELAPGVPVVVVSNVHAPVADGPPPAGRDGLLFVGSFLHPPNLDAVLSFHREVWPRVRRARPDARWRIVGVGPPPEVEALHGDGVEVLGWVADLAPLLAAARVSVAPLRFGAGVKGKIGEALSHGLPVVTTTVGAEGMALVHGEHCLVHDDPQALADAIVALHDDEALWRRLSTAGRRHIERTLGPAAARTALREALAALVPRIVVEDRPWTRLPEVLRAFAAEHAGADDVALLLPVRPGDPVPAAAVERVAAALDELEVEPDALPDLLVAPCEDLPPAPPAPPAGDVLLSVVVCAHGKRAVTETCLASLEAAFGERLGRDIELVLVDNASPDDTRDLLVAWDDRATVVLLDRNRNFAGGCNAGARAATGRVLVFLNNDTEVPGGALEALAEEALRPGTGVVGARLTYPDGRLQHGGFSWRGDLGPVVQPFHLFHWEDGDLPAAQGVLDLSAVTGACLAVRADLFEHVGGFDEAFVNGWEDVDLCFRVRRAGLRVRYRGDVAIVHHEGVTSGARYDRAGNEARFRARWGEAVRDDEHAVVTQLGGRLSRLPVAAAPAPDPDGAPLVVSGQAAGLGPVADEARGLLRALAGAGAPPAARAHAPTWVGADLDEEETAAVAAALTRPAAPGAPVVVLPDATTPDPPPGAPLVLRVAAPASVRPGALACVPTAGVRADLLARGWAPADVAVVPPLDVPAGAGPGGAGVVAELPAGRRRALAVLDALATSGARADVHLLHATGGVAHGLEAARRLPQARFVVRPSAERARAGLFAQADVVVALDAADAFDRTALIAAGAGAAVVCRAGGVAHELLGPLVHPVGDVEDPDVVAAAVRAARGDRTPRAVRADAVLDVCGPAAARAALDVLAPRAAGAAAFRVGDLARARAVLGAAAARSEDPGVLNDLAVVLHACGEAARAVALLERCAELAPDDDAVRENLLALAGTATAR